MNLPTAIAGAAFFALVALTFFTWLGVPTKLGERKTGSQVQTILAAITGILLFIACFAFGVWFSILRMKGTLWTLSV
jgi:hypothetical protein